MAVIVSGWQMFAAIEGREGDDLAEVSALRPGQLRTF